MSTANKNILPLRDSLFPNVPQFINYLPIPHETQSSRVSPAQVSSPVDLHDQLWRVCAAVKQMADDLYKLENIGQKFRFDRTYPFRKKPGQEEIFIGCHGSVSVTPFPSLLMLSKKDQLWRNLQRMKDKEKNVDSRVSNVENEDMFWDFLPYTFILPDEWKSNFHC